MNQTTVELRLFTFNCFGVPFVGNTRARLATLGRKWNDADLDVICLQEVQLSRYVPLLLESFSSFRFHAFEPFVHAPKGGLLILSRLPLSRQRFVLYEKRGRLMSPALADRILHKGILVAELELDSLPVAIVNTHLVANYSADWSHTNRYARHQQSELRQLRSVLDEIDPGALTVIAGDFNIPTHSPLYRDFVQATGLHDPLGESTKPTFRPPRFLPGRHAQPLDHVLIRAPRGLSIEAFARIVLQDKVRLVNGRHAHLSDHNGIEARVQIAEASP